jgi:hypothetical protein
VKALSDSSTSRILLCVVSGQGAPADLRRRGEGIFAFSLLRIDEDLS